MTDRDDQKISRIAELVSQLRHKCSLKDRYLVGKAGISVGEYNCLMEFIDSSTHGMKQLSERLGITPGGVTRVVAGLEERGLVERKMSLQDRRNIDVVLTPAGESIIGEIKTLSIDLHREIMAKIDPGIRGRVVDRQGQPHFIEINSMVAIHPEASYFRAAKAGGMTFPQLIGRVLEAARQRYADDGAPPAAGAE